MHAPGCEMLDRMRFAEMPPWPSPPQPDSERVAWTKRRAELVEEAGARCPCWQSEAQRQHDGPHDSEDCAAEDVRPPREPGPR